MQNENETELDRLESRLCTIGIVVAILLVFVCCAWLVDVAGALIGGS